MKAGQAVHVQWWEGVQRQPNPRGMLVSHSAELLGSVFCMRPLSKLEGGEGWRKTLGITLQLLHVDTHMGGPVMMALWHL